MPSGKTQAHRKSTPDSKAPLINKADSFSGTYANAAQIQICNWDFKLLFGEMVGQTEGSLVIELRTGVTMSPQHTKAFSEMLATHVAEYEKRFGPITWQQRELTE